MTVEKPMHILIRSDGYRVHIYKSGWVSIKDRYITRGSYTFKSADEAMNYYLSEGYRA